MITAVVRHARQCLRSPVISWASWAINVAMLCVLVGWILRDGKFPEAALALNSEIRARIGEGAAIERLGKPIATRLTVLKMTGVAAIGSAVCILAGLFAGPTSHRRILSWLAFMVLLALWMTLLVSWPELAWRGQASRLTGQRDGFDIVASSLRSDWPIDDGVHGALGPFMAYPKGDVRALILLTTPVVPNGSASLSGVERSPGGALRFQLAGNEHGAWVEWHPSGSVPETFVGGLMSHYVLDRFAPLGLGWYLARYEEGRLMRPSR